MARASFEAGHGRRVGDEPVEQRSRLRLLVPGSALLTLSCFVVLFLVDRPLYLRALVAIHEHPVLPPFLDTRFVTAQAECWWRGIDVYARNPCDPLGRTHDYSPLWLRLRVLALPAGATPWLGCLVDGSFVLALFLMPWRGEDKVGLLLGCLAACSWTSIFAAERGNTDLLMFAAAVLASRGLESRSLPRWGCAQALVLGVGLLKFYPLAMLALLLRAPMRRMLVAGTISVAVLLAFILCFRVELGRIGANMADGYFGHMFGARTVTFGLPLLADGPADRGFVPGPDPWRRPVSVLLLVLSSLAMASCAWARGRDPVLARALADLPAADRALLLAGSLLCVGCFFAHQNIGYRAVLLILVLPGLNALAWARGRAAFCMFRSAALLLVLLLWGGTLSRKLPVWLLLGLGWWWIVFVLSSILVAAFAGIPQERWRPASRTANGCPPAPIEHFRGT